MLTLVPLNSQPFFTEKGKELQLILIEGPEPEEIQLGEQYEFKGLYREHLFSVTVFVTRLLKKDEAGIFPPGEIRLKGELRAYSYRNANMLDEPALGLTAVRVQGLWRKSEARLSHLLPGGNGFLDIFE